MLIKYLKTHFFISRPKHSVAWMNTPPNCKKKNPLFGFYLHLITFLFYWFAWNLYIFLDYLSLKMAAPAAWSNLTCSSAWTHPFRCRNSLHPFSTSFRDPWRLELTPPVTEGEAGNPENRKRSRGKMQFPKWKCWGVCLWNRELKVVSGEWFLEERSKRFEQKVMSSDVIKHTILTSPPCEFDGQLSPQLLCWRIH